MNANLDFLKAFPTGLNGLYIVYELYSFDNLFRLLLKHGFEHEDALSFVLSNCSLSGVVFQERIHNDHYETVVSIESEGVRQHGADQNRIRQAGSLSH